MFRTEEDTVCLCYCHRLTVYKNIIVGAIRY